MMLAVFPILALTGVSVEIVFRERVLQMCNQEIRRETMNQIRGRMSSLLQ